MIEAFRAYLKKRHLLQPNSTFIVACSGGLDSVVLCELCHQAGVPFSIAHCNFGLRGEESERDAQFVQGLSEKYKVPFYVKKFDTAEYGQLKKLSVQEAARELRYQWFGQLQQEHNATFVLLAHHANDTIETVLMNLFRGTGLHGLTGMPEQVQNPPCLRPLLHHTRREIERFAREHYLEWVEDSSNASNKYTRNLFRNAILPGLSHIYPQAEENILDTVNRLQQTEALYDILVHGLLKKVQVTSGTETKIPIARLLQYRHTSLPYEVFKNFHFGEKQVAEILKLADSDSGSFVKNAHFRVIKHRKWFVITPLSATPESILVIEEGTKKATLPDGVLQLKTMVKEVFQLDTSPMVAQLDYKDIIYPLVVRRWKQGDYFYPLGLRKKKKLSRFFIDQKLALSDKEKVWVLESRSRIIWIIGHRIDDRFKVTEATKKVLRLQFVLDVS